VWAVLSKRGQAGMDWLRCPQMDAESGLAQNTKLWGFSANRLNRYTRAILFDGVLAIISLSAAEAIRAVRFISDDEGATPKRYRGGS